MKDSYVLLEIIPSHSNSSKGIIVQIQALKIKSFQIVKRFDYRLNEKLVLNDDLKSIISYDKEMFKYVNSYEKMMEDFEKFVGKNELVFLDDCYTYSYLKNLCDRNGYMYLLEYFNMTYSPDIYDRLIEKYHLEATNHFVDLLYESIIGESNNKE